MIILVFSQGVLAKVIQAGMYLWLAAHGRKKQKIYNHAEIYVMNIVSGALAKGIVNRSYHKAFVKDGKRRELLFYDMNLSIRQKCKLYNFVLDRGGTPYERMNFVWHGVRILSTFFTGTDIWLGLKRKAAKKRTFCIEHGADGVNIALPRSIKKPWRINPVEFKEYCDKNFGLPQEIKIPKKSC